MVVPEHGAVNRRAGAVNRAANVPGGGFSGSAGRRRRATAETRGDPLARPRGSAARSSGTRAGESMQARRGLLVSKAWVQAALLVLLSGFFVLGLLAYRTYRAEPPVAARFVRPDGSTLFTGDDVRRGQATFLR